MCIRDRVETDGSLTDPTRPGDHHDTQRQPGRHVRHFPNAVHVFSLGPVQSVTVSWRRRQRYVEQAEATEELLDDGRPLEQRRK